MPYCLRVPWGRKEVPLRSPETPQPGLLPSDVLETLSDIDEMSRRRPEVLGFFSVSEAGRIPGWDLEGYSLPCKLAPP